MGGTFVQSLCVLQWMLTFLFLGPASALGLLLLLRTRFWLVTVTYAGWWLWDWHGPQRGPRHWAWLRNWRIWDHFCDYFPIQVVREAPLSPGRSYVLPAHPHGISCIGVFGAFVTGGRGAAGVPKGDPGPCPGLRPNLAALDGLFRLPVYREYAMAAGDPGPCPGLRPNLAALDGLFRLPVYREYAMAAGSPGPCPGLRPNLAALDGLFRLPVYREYAMAAGSPGPCPGLRPNLAALDGLFRLPVYREYAMAAGSPGPCPGLRPNLAALDGLFRLPVYREYAMAAGDLGPCPGLRPNLAALDGLFRLPLYREYAMAAGDPGPCPGLRPNLAALDGLFRLPVYREYAMAAGSPGPCPGLRPNLAALDGLFRLPVYREYAMAAGLCPVSQRCLDAVLSRPSQALLIMVGGAAEALEGTPGCHRVTLSRRRGFVRLALRHGAPLVPVYVFGETETFRQPQLPEAHPLRRLQRRLKDLLGFAPCVFWGRGGLPVLPFRTPLTVVVGSPLEVPRVAHPPPELVAHYHGLYVQELRGLFERHKGRCGVPPETPLIVV